MIVYLDTSALVKLYIDEAGAPIVRRAAREAELMATSEIAYVEMRAALARRHREGDLSALGHQCWDSPRPAPTGDIRRR